MPVIVVGGSTWGDEGKGRIIDLLAQRYGQEVVGIRSTAGDNAGHTVVIGDDTLKFRLVPSTLASNKISVVGADVLVNPRTLCDEITRLDGFGVNVADNLYVSGAAHVVLPHHIFFDSSFENTSGGIGTTKRGIGPCVQNKAARTGIRIETLVNESQFRPSLEGLVGTAKIIASALYPDHVGTPEFTSAFDVDGIFEEYSELGRRIQPFVADTSHLLHTAVREGKVVLVESAQGPLLDLTHGAYPFVTSSRPITCGVLAGAGLGPNVDKVISVVKAYQTRVGKGPVFAEIFDDNLAEHIAQRGKEIGTVTGRRRRILWLDTAAVKYTAQMNGTTTIALTKLDVLDELEKIKICIGYKHKGTGNEIDHYPANHLVEQYEARYITMPGWQQDTTKARAYDDLPQNARNYIEKVEELTELPISIISVGPERSQAIVHREEYL